jgi:hypothetical protein
MKFYHDNAEIRHGADVREVGIGYQDKIIVGNFVNRDRPTWQDLTDAQHDRILGEKYYRHDLLVAESAARKDATCCGEEVHDAEA